MTDTGKQKGFSQMVVAGAGAAGLSAAIAAAERGLDVHLLESTGQLGGTVVKGQLHTLAGLFTPEGDPVSSPICKTLLGRLSAGQKRKIGKLWVLQIEPDRYAEALGAWIKILPNLNVYFHTQASAVTVTGDRIVHLGAGNLEFGGEGAAFVDATGTAELASLAGQAEDTGENSYGLIARVSLRGGIPDQAGRAALKLSMESSALLPESSVWADVGFEDRELFLKFNFPNAPETSLVRAGLDRFFGERLESVVLGEAVQRYGRKLISAPPNLGVDSDRSFPVAWPFESWRGAEVSLRWPEQIPFRLPEDYLRSANLSNLFAVGKCAGVPEPERSAARVTGGCWAMGEQVAKMAVRSRT